MSEKFTGEVPPPVLKPQDSDLEGWEEVAANYKEWHEGLQPHVERHLQRLGLSHLIKEAVASNEREHSAPEIQEALEDANTIHVDALMNSRTMAARAHDAGVDVLSQGRDNPAYWDIMAEITDGYADFRRGKGDSELSVECVGIICRLPQLLLAKHRLDLHGDDFYDDKRRDKGTASVFNARIRKFFDEYPDTSISGFKKELALITGYMFTDTKDRKHIIKKLNETIRGAMHEFAFGKVLERSASVRTGMQEATKEQDLQGIDYVINPEEPDELCIDVKASKHMIRELTDKAGIPNWNRPYYPKLGHPGYTDRRTGRYVPESKDVIVMYSLLEDEWFGDRFELEDKYIEAVAALVPGVIDESRSVLSKMRQQREQRRARRH